MKLLIEEKLCGSVDYFHRKQSDPPGYDDSSSVVTLRHGSLVSSDGSSATLSSNAECKPGKQALSEPCQHTAEALPFGPLFHCTVHVWN